ncbi:MAG: AAA family ATPase [Acidimicrobiales bacterium]
MSDEAGWACGRCAAENPPQTRFCGHCGAPASPSEAAPEQAASAVLRQFVAGPLAERLEQGAIDDERRLVTSLFADLSGFTPLADRLDPEQLQEVIDPLITMLSDVVARYEGYVDKYAGDALLAIFGAPVSHEDDAARALQVAIDMHEALRTASSATALDTPLTLHIGVNTGHVVARVMGHRVRMDYSVVGDAVILAQRLESAASAGETYVGEITYRLTEDDFEFEPLAPLTLKGKREPVPAWRLIGPKVSRTRSSGTLIGRDGELDRLEGVVRAAARGVGGLCTLTGEPGIGKTALTEEVRHRARRLDGRWLEGRCVSYGAALPYWPYVELLRDLLGLPPAQLPDRVSTRLAEAVPGAATEALVPYFERLLGLDPVELSDVEPEGFQRGLRRAFTSLLQALARDRPLVVAIDDVHWMDPSSQALTADLARLCDDDRLVLYLAGRPEAAGVLASIGDRVLPDRRHLVELGPLGPSDVSALIGAVARRPVPAPVQAAVAARTAGNPLFVEEVLHWIEETGPVGTLVLDDIEGLPPTVEGLLSARIDRLSWAAALTLQTASIIGRTVPLGLLRTIAGTSGVDASVEHLVRAGFLDRTAGEDVVVFHHPLVQETAYGRLLRRQRVRLHLQVAEAAETLYGAGEDSLALLARHLYLGASPKALDYLVRAAATAKRLFANDEAIVHLRRAAEVGERDARHDVLPGVIVDLADLVELRGDLQEAFALYTQARDAGGDLRSWQGIASTLRKRGKYQEALETLEAAESTLQPGDPGHGDLWLEEARTLLMARRFGDATALLHRALEVVEPGTVQAGYLTMLLCGAELAQGRSGAVALGQEAQEILERHQDQRGMVSSLRNLGWAFATVGELDRAATILRRGVALGERVGNAEELAACLLNLGIVESRRGAIDEAIDCDLRAIEELERMGHESGLMNGYGNLASAMARAERFDEALVYSERTLAAARRLGDPLAIAHSYLTQATVHLARGDPGAAGVRAEEAASLFEELGVDPPGREALVLAAQAWDAAGQAERAAAARQRLDR